MQPPPSPGQSTTVSSAPTIAPPPGMLPCNWSGSRSGDLVEHHRHYLGDAPGQVKIKYNLYSKPDTIEVFYRGQLIAGTGGPRSGRGAIRFDWNPVGGDYSVDVVVRGDVWETRWDYAMACPVAAPA
ncbi:MAG: hypothetical protein JOY64_05480 [Alphaproteobacteria bacterium]|nr:hypothetical protein [Alphaproteobacteria bacterium]